MAQSNSSHRFELHNYAQALFAKYLRAPSASIIITLRRTLGKPKLMPGPGQLGPPKHPTSHKGRGVMFAILPTTLGVRRMSWQSYERDDNPGGQSHFKDLTQDVSNCVTDSHCY